MTPTAAANTSPIRRLLARLPLSRKHIPLVATIAVWIVLYAAASIRHPNFFSYNVLRDLFRETAVLGITAVGLTFVILSGGIDLSVGAVIGFVSILVGVMVQNSGVHPAIAIPIALLVGAAAGAAMGCLIAFFALPPFLVTLAAMFLARGAGLVVSYDTVPVKHPVYESLRTFSGDVFPVSILVLLASVAAGFYLAHFTRFGRAVYAIGGNEQSALLMGIPVRSTKIRIYALSGLLSALAGVVFTLEVSGDAKAAPALELDAIAAVVIGGTLLTGGVGYVLGTLVGVLILGIINTVINWEGIPNSWWTKIAIGILLLAFILLQKSLQLGGQLRKSP